MSVPARRSAAAGWSAVILLLFAASLDYWWWDGPPNARLAWFNLPAWIYYFVALQLALAGAIWGLARALWRTTDHDSAQVGIAGDE